MSEFIELEDLKTGDYVKISGKSGGSGEPFLAVEVVIEPDTGEDKLEGPIQEIDRRSQTITVLGQVLKVTEEVKLRTEDGDPVSWEKLAPGCMVKVKGRFAHGAFNARKIRLKETKEFNIEELQGTIQRIDTKTQQILVNNIRVQINHKSILLKS